MNLLKTKMCRVARREIDESELSLRLSDRTQAHVDACASCRQFRSERTRLRELIGSLEPVMVPADFDMRLRARIAAERQASARVAFFPSFLVSTPAMATAAALVILAASIVWFSQGVRNQSPTIANNSPAASGQSKLQDDKTPVAANEVYSNAANTNSHQKEGTEDQNPPRATFRDTNRKWNTVLVGKEKAPSREFAVEPAEVIRQITDLPGQISLSAPDKPLVVSVEDNRGLTHRILLPPVSFGAQRLVDNRTPVSTSNSKSW